MSREAFNTLWATSPSNPGDDASFKEPRATIWGTGWEGGANKDAPKAGEQNWWQNRADFALQDLERYGAMTWDSDAIYAGGAPVRASDGNYYESLAGNNSGNNPASTTGFWRLLGASLYSIVPVAAVMDVAHNGVPDVGWLKCNGAVLVRASYPRLFDKIGTTFNTGGESSTQFRLPDTRGLFVRGFDDSRGVDPSRAFGSVQNDTFQNHFHMDPTATTSAPNGNLYELPYSAGTNGGFNLYDYVGSAPTSAAGNDETRPKNIAFAKWIKY